MRRRKAVAPGTSRQGVLRLPRSSEHFDAVIVGGGPAGSTAGYRLATEGARVLLLDRAVFPRDKPCGGGVTLRGARQLPFSLAPVVDQEVTAMDFRFRFGLAARHEYDQPIVLMTRRSRLDAYLLERAAEVGVEVREGVRVREVVPHPVSPEARGDGFRVRGAVVLGADGANGISAAALGGAPARWDVIAYEGNADRARYRSREFDGSMLFEIGIVPGGYGWIFPKADHANFGVGGWFHEGPQMKAHLTRLCAAHGVSIDDLAGLRGYRIPFRGPESPIAGRRLALIGDAAGLADPLSGDGMFEAFTSARLAAENTLAILGGRARDFSFYRRELRSEIGRHSAASWWAKLVLERWPRLGYGVAASRLGGKLFYQDLRGERTVHLPVTSGLAAVIEGAAQRQLLTGATPSSR
ncbi:MAG: geranylgeranyl reductase family protein [Thermoleophilia bacterium]|nr:geranylgeranyl reductase family protein [Thermoleophilia bacterium]MDH3725492.1 geranylgeranyl reductase family protein [Thermoleophilia bacterium]